MYRYKQPFRDGSTHVVLEPLDFIARLAALVPRPRLNLTRFHGVFAPNFKQRKRIVPRRSRRIDTDQPPAPMSWPLPHIPVLHGTGPSLAIARRIKTVTELWPFLFDALATGDALANRRFA